MFLTQETPGKILSLLGAAMFSMFFLFAVSATNASFSGTETAMPDTLAPENVVAVLDSLSSSYSNFLIDISAPARDSLAMVSDNVNFVIDEDGPTILAVTGFSALVDEPTPQVAGAYIEAPTFRSNGSAGPGFNIDTVYSVLFGSQ